LLKQGSCTAVEFSEAIRMLIPNIRGKVWELLSVSNKFTITPHVFRNDFALKAQWQITLISTMEILPLI
jgi:hypothetical protein